jgi:heme/copper-type cytochrome/quinol oxidase subunit 2
VDAKIIEINAKNWEFDKTEIRVKQWENIILKVNNTDVLHGIAIPAIRQVDDNELVLDTRKKWVFTFQCANLCGEWHDDMKWKIIIE